MIAARWFVTVVLVAGCGRIGFEASGRAISDGPFDGPTDGSGGPTDGSSDGPPNACNAMASPRVNHRSIGLTTDSLAATGRATVTAGSCSVTFDSAGAISTTVGEGDRIVIGSETLYVLRRDSDQALTLDHPATASHTDDAYDIRRAFNSVEIWEDERDGNLVGEDRSEIGIGRADGVFARTSPMLIKDSITDASHFMRLTAAITERHRGRMGEGVTLDGLSTACAGIEIYDDFTVIDHIAMRSFDPEVGCGPAALIVRGSNVLIRSMLIYNYATTNTNGSAAIRSGDSPGTPSATIQNLIAYNGRVGIKMATSQPANFTIENSTVWAMTQQGIDCTAGSIMNVTNTISVGTPKDFEGAGMVQMATISADGTGTLPGHAPGSLFLDVAIGSEDFHLSASSVAVDAGLDLSTRFTDDIDDQLRSGLWDIGADER